MLELVFTIVKLIVLIVAFVMVIYCLHISHKATDNYTKIMSMLYAIFYMIIALATE